MKSDASQEEKIVDAAIQCIETVGLPAVTIRKIAETAGVNSAAINYYFRSKDVLIDRVFEQTTENAIGGWETIIGDSHLTPEVRLRAVLSELVEGAFRFPNLARAHLHGPMIQGTYDTVFARRFRSFLSRARDVLAEALPPDRRKDLELRLTAMFSAAMGWGFLSGMYTQFRDAAMDTPEGRGAYRELLIREFMGGNR